MPTSAPFADKANTIGRVNNMKWQQEMTTSTAKDQRKPSADELSIGSSSSTVKKSLFNWRRNKLAAEINTTCNTESGGLRLNSGADKSATIARSSLSLSAGKEKDKRGDGGGGGGDASGHFDGPWRPCSRKNRCLRTRSRLVPILSTCQQLAISTLSTYIHN